MKYLNKYHVQQYDQSDCGVACLRSVLLHFGGNTSPERLRELSGTTQQGTTMLGLLQAARSLGLEATGYEADLKSLRQCREICVLHIIKGKQLQHYVTCYGYNEDRQVFLIGDPAEQKVQEWSDEQLVEVWQSKSLLLLKPTDKLQKEEDRKTQRKYWIKELIREDLILLGIALAIGIMIAALGLTTAIFSQQLIDKILPAQDYTRLFAGVGLLLVLLLARSGLGFIRRLLLLRQSRDFNIRIIDYFYRTLLFLPKSFFDNRKTGDLVARMNDTRRIQRVISKLIGSVMIDALMIVVASIAIFSYDWQIGMVILFWIPVFAWVVNRFHAPIISGQRTEMKAYSLNESNYIDTIQGIGDIKVANKQSIFAGLTKKVYSSFQQTVLDLGKVGIRFGLVTEVFSSIFITGIIAWSSVNVLNSNLSIGGMIAILQMVGMVMTSAGQLAIINIQLQEAKVAFDRMFEFTNIESEYDQEMASKKACIHNLLELKVENLAFRFPGRKPILKNISFAVEKGTWIAILGESGCGKSTLLQILQKFYTPESGKITANDIALELIAHDNWRSLLGVVSQEIKIFNSTILDNILLGDIIHEQEQLDHFFQSYGFNQYFQALPNGYATIVGEGGINLSGGQRQIVALARAVYRKPQLLLLDEPTAALDRNTEFFVLEILRKLKKNTIIITMTHRIKTARQADCICIIEQGKVVRSGDHHKLMETENLYSIAWHDFIK